MKTLHKNRAYVLTALSVAFLLLGINLGSMFDRVLWQGNTWYLIASALFAISMFSAAMRTMYIRL
jgi:hypothetical protein